MSYVVFCLCQECLVCSLKFFVVCGLCMLCCEGCWLLLSYCMCVWWLWVEVCVGMCLVMYDIEVLKLINIGWLIVDIVVDIFVFGWLCIEVDLCLLELLVDLQWQLYLVFFGEYVVVEWVVNEVVLLVEGK